MYRLEIWEDTGEPDSINDGWSEVVMDGSMEEIANYLKEHSNKHLNDHKALMDGNGKGFLSFNIIYIGE